MRILRALIIFVACLCACYTTMFHISYNPDKQYRFLLMMSSFKRPIFATGQMLRLMNQTYQNFDLSVSLKGVDQNYSRLTFEKEFWPYINKKRLFLRYDENGAQLSNLLDTVRDIDIENYDYFCKIDDDDWYAPEYLQSINDELNDALRQNKEVDYTATLNTYNLRENIETTIMTYNLTNLSGPTMCFSRRIIEMALEIDLYPDLYRKYLPDEPYGLHLLREDRMLGHLASYWGVVWPRKATEPLVIYGQQYRSVTRNDNYVDHKSLSNKGEKR